MRVEKGSKGSNRLAKNSEGTYRSGEGGEEPVYLVVSDLR